MQEISRKEGEWQHKLRVDFTAFASAPNKAGKPRRAWRFRAAILGALLLHSSLLTTPLGGNARPRRPVPFERILHKGYIGEHALLCPSKGRTADLPQQRVWNKAVNPHRTIVECVCPRASLQDPVDTVSPCACHAPEGVC